MSTLYSNPVDDGTYSVSLVVDDGDDAIELKAGHAESGIVRITGARMTIRETLALIAALSEAVTVALENREA
jgi:hypothetical protein